MLNPFDSSKRSNVGFFLINVPLAVFKLNTFAGIGSIEGETPPEILAFDTVGAIAKWCVCLKPVPLHHSGSPYSFA